MKAKKPVAKQIKRKKISKKPPIPNKRGQKIKRRKVRIGRILLALVFLIFVVFVFSKCLEIPIRNIYIEGNVHLTDQEIIELARVENYPSIIKTSKTDIRKRLTKDPRIISAQIQKKRGKELYIKVVENHALFYHQTLNITVLADLGEIDEKWNAPILLNYIPDTIYETFKIKMQQINSDILERVSEIMYQPSNVDEERFLFIMRDGNYVYLTLETLENINNYVNIYAEFIHKYDNKKGILNLDSGQYFTLLP